VTPEENERLEALERRLAEAEKRLAMLEAGAPRRRAAPGPKRRFSPVPHFEITFGLHWLSRIAVVTVVLALAFFFEYAFENHWISVSGRVLLGLGCGVAALLAGERFRHTGQRAYGQTLAAAGIGFFYLSFWAASSLYHLVPAGVGFGLMALVTAAAGALALRYDSAVTAALGLSGGFGAPLLLGHAQAPWFVLGYALVLDGGAAFAARARRWRWLDALALAGTLALYLNQSPAPLEQRTAYSLFVAGYFGIFAASTLLPVFMTVQVLAPVALAAMWSPGPAGLWLALAMAAAGLAAADRRGRPLAMTTAFTGFWLAYLFPNNGTLAVTLALLAASFLLFLAWPLWRIYGRRAALRPPDLLLMAANAGLFFAAVYGQLESTHPGAIGLVAVAIAAAEMGAARLLWRRDEGGAILAAGIAWVFLVLAAPVQLAGYRVTIVWAAEGAALAWIGTRFRENRAVAAALIVFCLVILRLGWIDSRMETATLLANARFLAFAAAAAALFAATWWIRTGWRAGCVYLGAHSVLLWALCLEAVDWARRTAAPENFRSFASASISVLAGGYALLLVAAGATRAHPFTRLLGMALIGLVVLKLYLYDVWLLGPFYRMAAFAILGIVLLVISYLFRPRVR
jgi:Predicted membrane protein (DUF2339)